MNLLFLEERKGRQKYNESKTFNFVFVFFVKGERSREWKLKTIQPLKFNCLSKGATQKTKSHSMFLRQICATL